MNKEQEDAFWVLVFFIFSVATILFILIFV